MGSPSEEMLDFNRHIFSSTEYDGMSIDNVLFAELLSQSLDDLGTTLGECLGRAQWSSPLDLATYLYYFTSGCVLITTRSHVLPEHFMIT